jgi:hypothetical protein
MLMSSGVRRGRFVSYWREQYRRHVTERRLYGERGDAECGDVPDSASTLTLLGIVFVGCAAARRALMRQHPNGVPRTSAIDRDSKTSPS